MPFPYVVVARLGAKPLEPFWKGSNALKAGTRDAGPVRPYRAPSGGTRPSVQPPAGVERKAGLIRALRGNASGSAFRRRLRRLDELRQTHRKGYALAHLAGLGGDGTRHFAFLLQPAKESVQALLQKLLPERRVGAG